MNYKIVDLIAQKQFLAEIIFYDASLQLFIILMVNN